MDLKDSLIKKGGLSRIDEALLNSSKKKPSADDSPVDDTPASDTPASDTPTSDTPASDTPASDTPASDTPASDAPASDAPASNAPASDTPASDTPASDSSALVSPSVSPASTPAPTPVSASASSHKKYHEPEAQPVRSGAEGDYKEHLIGHLTELRNRLIISGAVLIFGIFLIYPFSGTVLAYLWDHFIPVSVIMSVYSPTEELMTRLKLSAALSFCIFFPLFMYQLFKFMSRGLYKKERRFLIKVVPVSFIMFVLGVGLAYFIVLPLFLTYILFYSDKTAVAQVGLAETMNTIVSLTLGFGVVFQVPLLMVAVVRMGLVEEKTLRKGRFAVYGVLIGFAFLIAPDPTLVSQLIAGVALVVLFEISLILLKII